MLRTGVGTSAVLAAVAVSAALASRPILAAIPSKWPTFRTDRVSVRYPAGWFATARPLTPITGPGELLAVTSFPLPKNPLLVGCEPGATLANMPPSGAWIFVWYYGENLGYSNFPPRPGKFKLGGYECFGSSPSYMLRFRQSNRYFQVYVAFGHRAGAATRASVLQVLDSFTAKP